MNDNNLTHNENLPLAEEPTTTLSTTPHTAVTPIADIPELVTDEEMEQLIPLEESKRRIEKVITNYYNHGNFQGRIV